jgi:hypothetical protein
MVFFSFWLINYFVCSGSIEPQFYSALLKGLQLDPASLPHQMDESSWPKMKALFSEIFARRTRDEWYACLPQELASAWHYFARFTAQGVRLCRPRRMCHSCAHNP